MMAPEGFYAPHSDPRTLYVSVDESGDVVRGAYIPHGYVEIARGSVREAVRVVDQLTIIGTDGGRYVPGWAEVPPHKHAEAIQGLIESASHILGRDALDKHWPQESEMS